MARPFAVRSIAITRAAVSFELALLAVTREFGRRLGVTIATRLASVADPYRPELHYMRGPGPKWRQKHGLARRS
jgi:hypothetical protein